MKTTKINNIGKLSMVNDYWSLALGLLLLVMLPAQAAAVTYGKVQKDQVQSTMYNVHSSTSFGIATAPSVGFQSTSAYSGQWNQDAQQSMLNEDGSVNSGVYMGAPRRDPISPGGGTNGPGTPGSPTNNQQPLGDALLPLLLLACAFVIYKVLRRRRIIES